MKKEAIEINPVLRNLFEKEIEINNKLKADNNWGIADVFKIRQEMRPVQTPTKEATCQVEIFPGTLEGLSFFVTREPQKDAFNRLRYLLTGGLAVEVVTGAQRYHHDTDLVIFDYRNEWWKKYLTDNVISDRYWANMKLDPAFLEQTAWTPRFAVNGVEYGVSIVHPAIILVQKHSNAWGRPPRERDLEDIASLMKFLKEIDGMDKGTSWDPIVKTAISALPEEEQLRTTQRLEASYQRFLHRPLMQKSKRDLFTRIFHAI